jgi:hypothetical protein
MATPTLQQAIRAEKALQILNGFPGRGDGDNPVRRVTETYGGPGQPEISNIYYNDLYFPEVTIGLFDSGRDIQLRERIRNAEIASRPLRSLAFMQDRTLRIFWWGVANVGDLILAINGYKDPANITSAITGKPNFFTNSHAWSIASNDVQRQLAQPRVPQIPLPPPLPPLERPQPLPPVPQPQGMPGVPPGYRLEIIPGTGRFRFVPIEQPPAQPVRVVTELPTRIELYGFSLGGITAVCGGLWLKNNPNYCNIPVSIHTFGAPKACSTSGIEFLNTSVGRSSAVSMINWELKNDVVCQSPPSEAAFNLQYSTHLIPRNWNASVGAGVGRGPVGAGTGVQLPSGIPVLDVRFGDVFTAQTEALLSVYAPYNINTNEVVVNQGEVINAANWDRLDTFQGFINSTDFNIAINGLPPLRAVADPFPFRGTLTGQAIRVPDHSIPIYLEEITNVLRRLTGIGEPTERPAPVVERRGPGFSFNVPSIMDLVPNFDYEERQPGVPGTPTTPAPTPNQPPIRVDYSIRRRRLFVTTGRLRGDQRGVRLRPAPRRQG